MDTKVVTVSSKGQIALPVGMRDLLGIEKGDKLAAYVVEGFIVLKPLQLPDEKEFETPLNNAKL